MDPHGNESNLVKSDITFSLHFKNNIYHKRKVAENFDFTIEPMYIYCLESSRNLNPITPV